ncbi:MAG: hypothetical protein EBS21_06895, partial [Sphingomonadaceae bacterium]|nr:hypothetical protein [Sphingomonadaceae bacterium]
MTFGASVSAASLSTNTNSTVFLGGNVNTTGAQTYNDAVVLTNDVVLTGVSITLAQTVKSNRTARALTLTDSGTTIFGDAVGSVATGEALASLTVNGGGTTLLKGGSVRTTGGQSFGNALTLRGNTVLTTANGSVSFGSTLNSSELAATPATLTITAGTGDVSFAGIVGGATYAGTTPTTGALGAVTLASAKDVTISAAFASGAMTITHSGTFSTLAAGDIVAAGGFTQSGSGTNSLAGDITASGNIALAGATTLTGDVALITSGSNGTIDLAMVNSDGTGAAKNLLLKSSGALALDAAIGSVTPLGTIWIEAAGVSQGVQINSSNNSIISNTGFAVKAAKLAITSSALVDLIHPDNIVGTVAAALSNNADYRFTNYSSGGVTIGTIVNPFDASASVAGVKASGATNTSSASFVVGGRLTQTAGAILDLGGNLSINAQPGGYQDVAFNNTGAGALGVTLGNSIVAGNFDIVSVGNVTQAAGINANSQDADLQVGGNFNLTGGGTFIQGNSAFNVFGFGAGTQQANTISLNGVITLSIAGGKLTGTSSRATYDSNNNNSCVTGCASVDLVTGATVNEITVISQAGGKTINSTGTNPGSAVVLSQVNKVRGTFSVKTAGAYVDLGSAVETGIKAAGALTLNNNLLLTVQQSSANATSNVAGRAALNLGDANGFGGTISANAFGVPVTIKNTQALQIGSVQGSTVTITTTAGGLTQAENSAVSTDKLIISSAGAVTLNNTNSIGVLAASAGGNLSVTSGRALTIGDSTTGVSTSVGNVTIQTLTGKNLTLAKAISSAGNITLASAGSFINNVGASALTTGASGVWRIWSQDPALDTLGGLTPGFKQYNATYGGTTTIPQAASALNGVLYTLAPKVVVSLSGTVSKVYDGLTTANAANVTYDVSGALRDYLSTNVTDTDVVTATATSVSFENADVARDSNGNVLANKKVIASGADFTVTSSAASGAIPVFGYQLDTTNPVNGLIGEVTPKTLVVGGLNSSTFTKVYNANTTVAISGTAGLLTTIPAGSGTALDGTAYAGDDVSLGGTASGTFNSANVADANKITLAGLSLTGADAGNYSLRLTDYAASITPFVVNLSGTRVYNAMRDVAASVLTIGTLVNGETLKLDGTGRLTGTKDVGTAKTFDINSLALQDDTGLASNYTLVGGTRTVAITVATISAVTGITANDKTYDATTDATLVTTNAQFGGKFSGDTLTVATATGAFINENAGTKAVNITGIVLDGTDAGNYTLASDVGSTTATINTKLLTVTAQSQTKVYDAGTSVTNATGYDVVGLVNSESLSTVTLAYDSQNAGTRTITPSNAVAGNNTQLSNYDVQYVSDTASTITPFIVSLTGARTYDATADLDARVLTIGALVPGEDLTLAGIGTLDDPDGSGAGLAKNVGTGKTFSIGTLTLGNGTVGVATNYTLVGGTRTADITPANLTVTTSNVVKTYDGGLSVAGATTAPVAIVAANSGTQLFGTDTLSGGDYAFTNVNAGTGNRTVTVDNVTVNDDNGGDNYNVSYVSNTTSTINKKLLTVTAQSQTKVYNAGTSVTNASGYDVVGLVGSESLSAVTLAYDSQNAGTRTITPSDAVAAANTLLSNYNVQYESNIASSITPFIVNLSGTRVYNAATDVSAAVLTIAPLVNGETLKLDGSGTLTGTKDVGTAKTFDI